MNGRQHSFYSHSQDSPSFLVTDLAYIIAHAEILDIREWKMPLC